MQFESYQTVKVALEQYGIDYTEERKAKSIIFRGKTNQNRKELLASMEFSLRQVGISAQYITKSNHSGSAGHIETDDRIYIVLKPLTGATENLKITGAKLTALGNEQVLVNAFEPEQQLKCRSFESAEAIRTSILTHLMQNPDVDEAIERTFMDYFNSDDQSRIEWNPLITQSQKNELAKHIGEPLLGYLAFKQKDWGRTVSLDMMTFPIKSFKVPIYSNHTEIDSIFVDRMDHIYYVSNKVTRGARASFFTNILPILLKVQDQNLNRPLRELVYTAKSVINPERNGKQIVYRFGLNYILGMNLNNPYKVFSDITSKKETKELAEVVKTIREFFNNNHRPYKEIVLSKLNKENGYSSLTVFLCQEIARLLNEETTNRLLVGLVAGKRFYQASLNTADWNNGIIRYTIEQSGKLNLRIIGDKSTYGDIHAGHGLLNYALDH